MKGAFKKTVAAILAAMLCGLLLLSWTPFRAALLSKGISPETRGYNLARDQGCFYCHGSWGQGGVINAGGGKIPGFQGFTFLMSIHNEAELKAWIMDGAPEKLRRDPEYEAAKAKRAVIMPAYGDQINEEELALLLSFYHGISGTIRPVDPLATKGYEAARDLGCYGCHGPGGRFDLPNPGALAGRIPAWHGEDFGELARDEAEVREWILDGAPQRLAANPLAAWFLNRQTVKMPAYRELITEDQLEAILAYIRWLRDPGAPGHLPSFQEPKAEEFGDGMPY